MATKKDLAESYASFIRRNAMTLNVVEEICNKLDSLSYSDNGKKLSKEDKLEIIGYIEEALNERRTGGYRFSTESEDSTAFIALMKAIADRYKK